MNNIFPETETANKKKEWQLVVRISTSFFESKHGLTYQRQIRYLKRKSFGWNPLEDEFRNIGEEALATITNLSSVKDGIYEVVLNSISTDWETGYSDYWDWKLIPYVED